MRGKEQVQGNGAAVDGAEEKAGLEKSNDSAVDPQRHSVRAGDLDAFTIGHMAFVKVGVTESSLSPGKR